MPTKYANDTEAEAGNTPDSHNIGDRHAEQVFNNGQHDSLGYTPDMSEFEAEFGDEDADPEIGSHSNFNADEPTENIDNTKNLEEAGGGGEWDDNVNYNEPQRQPTEAKKGPAKLRASLRGKGASSSIVSFLIAGGAVTSFILSPSLLLVHLKEVFHNDRADSTRTNTLLLRALLAYKFKAAKDPSTCTKSKIACKMGTLSKKALGAYKSAGFKVHGAEVNPDEKKKTGKDANDIDPNATTTSPGEDANARVEMSSLEFSSDGHVSTTGSDFTKHIDDPANVSSLREATKASNPLSSFFQNIKFSDMLKNVLHIKNGKTPTNYAEGDDDNAKKARDAEFNDSTGGNQNTDEANKAHATKTQDQATTDQTPEEGTNDEEAKKGSGLAFTVVRTLCKSYQVAKIGILTVETEHMLRLANFAMEFLKVADSIKAGAAIGTVVTYMMDKLTFTGPYSSDPNDPRNGLSATDSQGYKIAAHGDVVGLASWALQYVLGYNGGLVAIAGILDGIDFGAKFLVNSANAVIPGVKNVTGKNPIKTACRLVNNKSVMAAQCIASVGAIAGISAETGPLDAVITVGAAALCVCQYIPTGGIVGGLLNTAEDLATTGITGNGTDCKDVNEKLEKAMKLVVGTIAGLAAAAAVKIVDNWNIGSDTKGVDAGNAIAAGAGIILSKAAESYALKPSSSKEYHAFVSYTQPTTDRYIALERDDARSAPFDLSNSYSFISTLADSVNMGSYATNPIIGGLGNLFGLIPTAASKLVPVAQGLYSEPVQHPEGRDNCNTGQVKNQGLANLTAADGGPVAGDTFCIPIDSTPVSELQSANKEVTDDNSKVIETLMDYMTTPQQKTESNGGTREETDNILGTANCDQKCQDDSSLPSIDENGKPTPGSQYDKFITYCTDERKDSWGNTSKSFEEGSSRDQDWFSGQQCEKESPMMANFRMWHNLCAQNATLDGTQTCFSEDDAAATAGTCGDGSDDAIYYCALPYDPYGYGPHPHGSDNVPKFVSDFKAGINPVTGGKLNVNDEIVDCSGLVTVSVWDAFHIDLTKEGGNHAPEDFEGGPHWTKVDNPAHNAQKGDVITFPDHVEIIESTDGKTYRTFGSHGNLGGPNDIGPSSYAVGTEIGVYRFHK